MFKKLLHSVQLSIFLVVFSCQALSQDNINKVDNVVVSDVDDGDGVCDPTKSKSCVKTNPKNTKDKAGKKVDGFITTDGGGAAAGLKSNNHSSGSF